MEILDIFSLSSPQSPTALALGLFDGVHIGHRKLLEQTVLVAKEKGLVPGVFTFRSTKYKQTSTLFSREVTYRQMQDIGIEKIYEADFEKIAHKSPNEFVDHILRQLCSAACLLCGDNFRFGKGAAGNAQLLCQLFGQEGEQVIIVPPVEIEGKAVSSTLLREAIISADTARTLAYLGMPYPLYGEITHGKALGRKLQFPTINLDIPSDFVVPKRGVYVSLAKIGETFYPAISNIGVRPTVEHAEKDNCETHLLSATGDFYGQAVEVSLLAFLREETKFQSQTQLVQQIEKDCQAAKLWFATNRPSCYTPLF